MPQDDWFEDWDNIITLTTWMSNNDYRADEVAYAVEKPWKFEDEWNKAKKEVE
jgi:hypothetical protein